MRYCTPHKRPSHNTGSTVSLGHQWKMARARILYTHKFLRIFGTDPRQMIYSGTFIYMLRPIWEWKLSPLHGGCPFQRVLPIINAVCSVTLIKWLIILVQLNNHTINYQFLLIHRQWTWDEIIVGLQWEENGYPMNVLHAKHISWPKHLWSTSRVCHRQ